ncbi:MAG TPA: phage tail protein, partial [Sphingomonas sp.]
AEARLAREWAGRTQATLSLPWRRLDIGPGAILSLPGQDGAWRVTQRAFEAMVLTLTATRLPPAATAAATASAGRPVSQPDLTHGPTTLALLDLPMLGDDPATVPTLAIAAAGVSAGWRRASVIGSLDGGASWSAIGDTAPAAILGTTLTALPPGSAMLFDTVATLDVALLNDAMTLAGNDAIAASATANLALVGGELIQFAAAEQTGPASFRLSRLLRGRRGTEWAMASHVAGEAFVLVDAETLLGWTLPVSAIGASVMVAATGIGDARPAEAAIVYQGRALRPPAPVALHAVAGADGSVAAGWTRRSRAGWTWIDGTDAPLGEESELYQVVLARGGAAATITTTAPAATLPADVIAALPGAGPITATVAQIGTIAVSLPAARLPLP